MPTHLLRFTVNSICISSSNKYECKRRLTYRTKSNSFGWNREGIELEKTNEEIDLEKGMQIGRHRYYLLQYFIEKTNGAIISQLHINRHIDLGSCTK